MKDFICIAEASKLSGLSRYFVVRILKENKIKCKKIFSKTFIPIKEFKAILKKYEL